MGDGSEQAASAETHISWVLLRGDIAFKIAKPVVTDVLDQGTVALRRSACEREVALNRRLAPDVYLGVGSIVLDGEELEPVVVMRRMPEDRRLTKLLDTPNARQHVRDVARAVAVFHASATVLSPEDADRVAGHQALERRWADDVAATRALTGADVSDRLDTIERRAQHYLAGRAGLFGDRVSGGLIRDLHGDLLADDIFCLDDGPRLLDCLAFADELRWGDVLADVAFLVMDLQRLGHPHLGRALLRDYCEFSDEHHPGSLAHLHVAQRALVRAKVAALRAGPTTSTPESVVSLLDLTIDHLDRATVRAVLVGGLPGSGKSTVANRLADELGWIVLSSDEVRRDLRLRHEDIGDAAYEARTLSQVQQELASRAERALRGGVSVVLDATWTAAADRESARAMARAAHAEIAELRCVADRTTCRDRVAHRATTHHSEATPDVVDALAARTDPWPEARDIDTEDVSADDIVEAATLGSEAAWLVARQHQDRRW